MLIHPHRCTLFFLSQSAPLDARTLFFDRESLPPQIGLLPPPDYNNNGSRLRLPHNLVRTPVHALGLPYNLFRNRSLGALESRSRSSLACNLLRNRALARDVLATYSGATLSTPRNDALAKEFFIIYSE